MKHNQTYPRGDAYKSYSRNRINQKHSSLKDAGMDFICKHCNTYVSSHYSMSGVQNRNHCPCCLWSRHLDFQHAGDRLSACKALMKPVGLTFKRNFKKYESGLGELMVIHQCTECKQISINRIAADDIPQTITMVYQSGFTLDCQTRDAISSHGIRILTTSDDQLVHLRLFGRNEKREDPQFGLLV